LSHHAPKLPGPALILQRQPASEANPMANSAIVLGAGAGAAAVTLTYC
jgi:hypothetical protein